MNEFSCRVVSSDKTFFDGMCTSLKLPAIDGEIVFMAHHQPCVVAIAAGVLHIKTADNQERIGICSTGMLRFYDNQAVVLVDTVERPEDIDEVRAQREKEEAEEAMREAKSLTEYKMSEAALARAMNRLSGRSKYTQIASK